MNYDLYNAAGELVYRGVSIVSAVYHTGLEQEEIEWAIEEYGVASTDEWLVVERGTGLPGTGEADLGDDPLGDWHGRNE